MEIFKTHLGLAKCRIRRVAEVAAAAAGQEDSPKSELRAGGRAEPKAAVRAVWPHEHITPPLHALMGNACV